MHISAKCSVALHCLLLLAEFGTQRKVTSELLASSTGCNAVTIRGLMGALKRAGLVSIARGVGGARLARPPEPAPIKPNLARKGAEEGERVDLGRRRFS